MTFRVDAIFLYFLCVSSLSLETDNCHTLSYVGIVPKTFDTDVFEMITIFPSSIMAICSNKCLENQDCRVMDVCDSDEEKYCRLVRSLNLTFTAPNNGQTCRRFKVDKRCDKDEFFDRISGQCLMKSIDLCDFETSPESSCSLIEATDDIFNWKRHSETTLSYHTGPDGARVGTFYKYIETTARETGDNAKLVSNRLFEDKTYCFSMFYHMYGQTTGTLKIQTKTGNDTAVTHWELSGDQGNQWYSIDKLNLPLNNNTKIIIEGITGGMFYSDISVDYIILRPFSCV